MMKLILEAISSLFREMEANRTSPDGGISGTAESQISMLIETDMLPTIHDSNGKILTDSAGKVILRY